MRIWFLPFLLEACSGESVRNSQNPITRFGDNSSFEDLKQLSQDKFEFVGQRLKEERYQVLSEGSPWNHVTGTCHPTPSSRGISTGDQCIALDKIYFLNNDFLSESFSLIQSGYDLFRSDPGLLQPQKPYYSGIE